MNQVRYYGLNYSLGGAIAAIAITVVLCCGGVLVTLNQLRDAIDAKARSQQIIRTLDRFRSAMFNQETGLRGYLLTGNKSSLDPYYDGVPELERAIGTLDGFFKNDSTEARLFAEATEAARAWQTGIGQPVLRAMADPATRTTASDLERTGQGKLRFDTFRDRLAAIEKAEDQKLALQAAILRQTSDRASLALWIGASVILLICAGVAYAISRLIVRPLTQLAAAMSRLAQRDLTLDVPGTDRRNEVGAMARAVEVFKKGLIELDRTSLLRVTADTLPAMVGYIDAQSRIGFLNGEFARWFDLGGTDVAEFYGKPVTQAFGANGFPGAQRELLAALEGEETRFEHRIVRRGTGRRAFEAFYRPHKAPDGRVLGVVTLLTDITERKQMEIRLAQNARDLRRSNEELEQFAYVASHDLKAPLRGIDNLVTWIEEDLENVLEGDVRTNMDLVKSRVRRLESLLDDLLAYSRAGRSEVTIEPVDTRELVEELAHLVNPPPGFSIVVSPTLPTIETARAPLTQALQNLISNAIKHHDHPATGHIEVTAALSGNMIQFTVADDGPGVPEQFRERVFGMFQTLRPRDEIEGSGMGLAIVKKLVERHGGKIWLSDVERGPGLAVHFTWLSAEKEDKDGPNRESAAD